MLRVICGWVYVHSATDTRKSDSECKEVRFWAEVLEQEYSRPSYLEVNELVMLSEIIQLMSYEDVCRPCVNIMLLCAWDWSRSGLGISGESQNQTLGDIKRENQLLTIICKHGNNCSLTACWRNKTDHFQWWVKKWLLIYIWISLPKACLNSKRSYSVQYPSWAIQNLKWSIWLIFSTYYNQNISLEDCSVFVLPRGPLLTIIHLRWCQDFALSVCNSSKDGIGVTPGYCWSLL